MYLKLGKDASVFYDARTQVKIVNKQAIEYTGPKTKRLALALKNGAIEEIKEAEYLELKAEFDRINAPKGKAAVKEAAPAPAPAAPQDEDLNEGDTNLHKMSDDQLLQYYKENFEVGPDEEAAFLKLKSKKAKIAFLTEE